MSLTTLRSSQTLLNAALAGSLAALICWAGPPGTDFPAHVFQLHVYLQHGFAIWTNYWYAGRYTFVGYSLIYYPLAALVGIKLLAVISVAASAAAFTLVVRQAWGDSSVWVSRFFALVAAASLVTAAFPYGLGLAFALGALVAIARGRLAWFSLLALLSFAASALAFLFLLVILAAAAIARSHRELVKPAAAAIAAICALALVLWRLFPDPGHYPFPASELAAVLTFCALGAALTWRVENARVLNVLFIAYGGLCILSYAVPSNLGGNVVRLQAGRGADRDPRLLAAPLAAAADRDHRARPRGDLEPLAPRLQLHPQHGRPVGHGGLLDAGRQVPAPVALAELPRRGRGHRRPLGSRLPPPGRDPDRPWLVPPGRLPAERGALRQAHPHRATCPGCGT